LLFYEYSSLYGTMPEALSRFETDADEITIIATPYYMPEAVRDGRNLAHTWIVDGKGVTPDTDPRLVTLSRDMGGTRQRVQHTYQSNAFDLARGIGEFEVFFMNSANALPTL
jgi:hypothetical protein